MTHQSLAQETSELYTFLRDPNPFVPAPRWGLTPTLIGTVRMLMDCAQVAVIGSLVVPLLSALPDDGTTRWRLAGLGVLVAVMAAVVGGRLATPGPLTGHVAHQALVYRAAATPIALAVIATVGHFVWPWHPQPAEPVTGFLTWGMISGAISGLIGYGTLRLQEAMPIQEPVIIVGPPEESEPLAALVTMGSPGMRKVVQLVDDRAPDGLRRLTDFVDEQPGNVLVLMTAGLDSTRRTAAICQRLADRPVRLALALDTAALTGGLRGSGSPGHLTLVNLWATPRGTWSGTIKRAMDLLLGSIAFVLLSPVMVAAAIALRLESPGPVLFSQWRFGVGSKPIRVLKFRTMHATRCDATGAMRTAARDPRVTRVGRILRRTSIDELPQLVNVLRGDMSLVGPRPHALHMRVGADYYFEAVNGYRARHIVRPGITGWAQVNGSRGEGDTLEKARRRVQLDLWYIENWSLLLDVRILLLTLFGGFISPKAD